jgi:hypothetical protein
MDLSDIWQEHKNWILGILAGVVLFFVGSSLISSQFDLSTAQAQARRATAQVTRGEFFQAKDQTAARRSVSAIEERLDALRALSYFVPRKEYLLEGKGDYSTHYLATSSDASQRMRRAMNTANVDLLANNLGLPASSPTQRGEVQRYLLGLDLVTDALDRLLAASDEVLRELPGQHGLRTIERLQIQKPPRAARNRYRGKDFVELGDKVLARIEFRADSVTLERWLERLRARPGQSGPGARPILLDSIQVQDVGRESGEPLEVKVDLMALIQKES